MTRTVVALGALLIAASAPAASLTELTTAMGVNKTLSGPGAGESIGPAKAARAAIERSLARSAGSGSAAAGERAAAAPCNGSKAWMSGRGGGSGSAKGWLSAGSSGRGGSGGGWLAASSSSGRGGGTASGWLSGGTSGTAARR
jgi:hypothetical protein